MSELEVKYVYTLDEIEVIGNYAEGNEFYLKSESDKALANKDCEIKKLKDSLNKLLKAKTEQILQEVIQKALIYGEGFVPVEHAIKLVAEIRHNKYNRCLDIARWCESEGNRLEAMSPIFDTDKEYWEYNSDYWLKWKECWLKIAEKFKEMNNDCM